MNKLRNLQQQALDAFLGDEDAIAGTLDPNGIPPSVRVDIYRNNLRENYRKALANTYPVVERLVGLDCFRGLAASYCRQYPSTSGDLQDFGQAFPALLADLYTDTDFAYLPDIARLEQAIESALIAPRSKAIDIEGLAGVDPADHDRIQFRLRPGVSLVRSAFPVLAIWQANQQDVSPIVDLDAGGALLAVSREEESAEIRPLDAGAMQLAECFADGLTLGAACARLEDETVFELSPSLNSLFLNRCLGSFQLAPGESSDR